MNHIKTDYLLALSKPKLILHDPKTLKASLRTSYKRSRLSFLSRSRAFLTLLVFVFSFVLVFTAIAFTSGHSGTFSHTSKQNGLARVLRSNGVLLQPQIIGRLGNQMFEWASAWGIAQRLRADFNSSLPVALVVQSTNDLYM